MTAINVVLKKDRALMMTDASMYLQSGLIVGFGQKAFALPTLGAALACRGGQLQAALLTAELPLRAPSFEALIAGGADGLAATIRPILRDYGELFPWKDVQVVLVGYCHDVRSSRGFVFDSTEDAAEELDEFALGPLPDEEEEDRLHSIGCDMERGLTVERFDPVRHGIPIMEAQRRMKVSCLGLDQDEQLHVVGGHVLLTEVSRAGVSQRVVHRWADQANENIQPDPFEAPPVSRADRRRLERAGR